MPKDIKQGGPAYPHRQEFTTSHTDQRSKEYTVELPHSPVKSYNALSRYLVQHDEKLSALRDNIAAANADIIKGLRRMSKKEGDHENYGFSLQMLGSNLAHITNGTFLESVKLAKANEAIPLAPPESDPSEPSWVRAERKFAESVRRKTSTKEEFNPLETAAGQILLELPDQISSAAKKFTEVAQNYASVLSDEEKSRLQALSAQCEDIGNEMLAVRKCANDLPDKPFAKTFEQIARGHGYPGSGHSR